MRYVVDIGVIVSVLLFTGTLLAVARDVRGTLRQLASVANMLTLLHRKVDKLDPDTTRQMSETEVRNVGKE
jgi:hypothetical protein